MRRAVAVLLVAAGCLASTATVFSGMRQFVWSEPGDGNPTVLYLTVMMAVGAVLVAQTAAAPVGEGADAGWLLAVAIISGVPALAFSIVVLVFPFLAAFDDGWRLWVQVVFLLTLIVTAGPALGVGISASYLLRADEMTRRRRVISVSLIFFATAALQVALLIVTRYGLGGE